MTTSSDGGLFPERQRWQGRDPWKRGSGGSGKAPQPGGQVEDVLRHGLSVDELPRAYGSRAKGLRGRDSKAPPANCGEAVPCRSGDTDRGPSIRSRKKQADQHLQPSTGTTSLNPSWTSTASSRHGWFTPGSSPHDHDELRPGPPKGAGFSQDNRKRIFDGWKNGGLTLPSCPCPHN